MYMSNMFIILYTVYSGPAGSMENTAKPGMRGTQRSIEAICHPSSGSKSSSTPAGLYELPYTSDSR